MSDQTQSGGTGTLDPSGNYGPTEHGPSIVERGARRMIVSAAWGGTPAQVTSENGQDVSPWNPDCSWYQYGTHYGLNGCQHPGMDISLPVGTTLYAAVGGKVVHAGHSGYYMPLHVNIQTDDGEVHIYGHMSAVAPGIVTGGRVETGQVIGQSGEQNGPHLHAERRVPNSRCSSGYCSEDPEPVLVGGGQVEPIQVADRVATVDALNLRDRPGPGAGIIETLQPDEELCVRGGPTPQDGYDWYDVRKADGDTGGWVAGQYCRVVQAGGCSGI